MFGLFSIFYHYYEEDIENAKHLVSIRINFVAFVVKLAPFYET